VLDRELAVPAAHEQFGPDGDLLDPELQIGLRELLAELLREVRTTIELRGVPSLCSGGALR
jgi:hypothetical protein